MERFNHATPAAQPESDDTQEFPIQYKGWANRGDNTDHHQEKGASLDDTIVTPVVSAPLSDDTIAMLPVNAAPRPVKLSWPSEPTPTEATSGAKAANPDSLSSKHNKIIAGVAGAAILLGVVVAGVMSRKNERADKPSVSVSAPAKPQKPAKPDVKSEAKQRPSPEAVDAGGPADYSALPLDQIYDQNWYKTGSELVGDPGHTAAAGKQNDVGMDASAPVNDHDGFYNFYNARYQIDSAAEKGQIGKVIRSEVSNSAADDTAMDIYYAIKSDRSGNSDNSKEPKLTDAQRNYFERLKSVVGGDFKTYTRNTMYANRVSYILHSGYSFNTTYNLRHPGSVGYADMYQSNAEELNVPYVDENGNSIGLDKSAHYDSLMSVVHWMLYDQGFYNVAVSPAGVWGTCRLDNRGYMEAVQIVLPSQDNPDKFDVFVGVLDDIYYNRVLTSDVNYTVADYSGTNDYALYASVLRQSNKSTGILPFRAILHNVDRPLRAKDNELSRVMRKFGVDDRKMASIASGSFATLVGSNMFVGNEVKGVGYGGFIHRGDVKQLPHYNQYVGSGSLTVYLNGLNAHGDENHDDVERYRAFMLKAAPTSRQWYGEPNKGIDYNKGMLNYDEFVKLDRAAFGN